MRKLRCGLRMSAACAVAVGLASLATPAVAVGSTVSVSQATLLQKGAAVAISFTYTCDTGYGVEAFGFNLTQAVKKGKIVRGGLSTNSADFQCTGLPETKFFVVEGDGAFRKGDAEVAATLYMCSAYYDPESGFGGCFPTDPTFSYEVIRIK